MKALICWERSRLVFHRQSSHTSAICSGNIVSTITLHLHRQCRSPDLKQQRKSRQLNNCSRSTKTPPATYGLPRGVPYLAILYCTRGESKSRKKEEGRSAFQLGMVQGKDDRALWTWSRNASAFGLARGACQV